jgi:fructose-1,6-bisphosphatase
MTTTSVLNHVERACTDLARDGLPVTFAAVATRTGIARSTLYRNQALRSLVEHHRRNHTDGTITAITDEIATLRTAVETLAAKVRHHDTQIRHLAKDRKS